MTAHGPRERRPRRSAARTARRRRGRREARRQRGDLGVDPDAPGRWSGRRAGAEAREVAAAHDGEATAAPASRSAPRTGRGPRRRELVRRDEPVRGATRCRGRREVRSTGSPGQVQAAAGQRDQAQSTTWPETCRNATWSPAGDHAGAQLSPSLVRRRTSAPVVALRMTTSVPKALVLVAAMYLPSGDHDGCR